MAKQIIAPEDGDKVRFADDTYGAVHSEDTSDCSWLGENDWQVQVLPDDEEEDEREDVQVSYDETSKTWREI